MLPSDLLTSLPRLLTDDLQLDPFELSELTPALPSPALPKSGLQFELFVERYIRPVEQGTGSRETTPRLDSHQLPPWGVMLRRDGDYEDAMSGEITAFCGYFDWNLEHSRGMIGLVPTSLPFRSSIFEEALRIVIDFGFTTMMLHRIEALVEPDNIVLQDLLLRSGMQYEATLRQSYRMNDVYHDVQMFAVLND